MTFLVIEINEGRDREYILNHSCEIHCWTLSLPCPVMRGTKPQVGEEVGINAYLTLTAKEKRQMRSAQQMPVTIEEQHPENGQGAPPLSQSRKDRTQLPLRDVVLAELARGPKSWDDLLRAVRRASAAQRRAVLGDLEDRLGRLMGELCAEGAARRFSREGERAYELTKEVE
jgi:hypothetical protein